jgi:hypothetical protein
MPFGLMGDLQPQPEDLAGGDALGGLGHQLGLHARRLHGGATRSRILEQDLRAGTGGEGTDPDGQRQHQPE